MVYVSYMDSSENSRKRGNPIGAAGINVASNLKRLRQRAGLDLRGLSARLRGSGHLISASGLSKIENMERRVDVDDLVALAVALDVSPLALLLPNRGDLAPAPMTATNGELGANVVWLWGRGDEPLHLPAEPEDDESKRAIRLFHLESVPHIHKRTGILIREGQPGMGEGDFDGLYRSQGVKLTEDWDG